MPAVKAVGKLTEHWKDWGRYADSFSVALNTEGLSIWRFGSADGRTITDEIALNPSHFKSRSAPEVLSTLVHEMAHLWQHHYGQPSRSAYHNSEWAGKMSETGLIPSDTGKPGGKQTGQHMTHYIEPGRTFALNCAALLAEGFNIPYVELWGEAETGKRKKTKAESKTKFTCASCGQAAWGKPALVITCGHCDEPMNC